MTDLDDHRLFLRTVELGAIRPVAREFNVEPSSVSRRLTALETRLGTKLFARSTVRSQPTEAGQRYYERLRVLIAQFDALQAETAGEVERPTGLLRVNAAIDFGQRFVAGWLMDFRAEHPDVQIEPTLSARNIDLATSGVDVAFRAGELTDASLVARRLGLLPRVLVAAPTYLARRGVPQTPADLASHDHVYFLPEHRQQPLRLTGPDGEKAEIARKGGVTINAVLSNVEAVRRGFGIALGPAWAFHAALQAGDVVEILPGWGAPALPLSAVRLQTVILPARIRAFVDHAARAVRAIPGIIA